MFNWLKRASKKIFGGDRIVAPRESRIEVKEYDVSREKIEDPTEWEKQFQEYCDFNFVQSGENYKLRLHFKEAESRKETITTFVKEGMHETGGDLAMVIINVGIIYNLGVATRGIKEGNQILLFFN